MVITSWDVRVTIGSIMTASASAAANPDFPFVLWGATQVR